MQRHKDKIAAIAAQLEARVAEERGGAKRPLSRMLGSLMTTRSSTAAKESEVNDDDPLAYEDAWDRISWWFGSSINTTGAGTTSNPLTGYESPSVALQCVRAWINQTTVPVMYCSDDDPEEWISRGIVMPRRRKEAAKQDQQKAEDNCTGIIRDYNESSAKHEIRLDNGNAIQVNLLRMTWHFTVE